MRESFRSRGTQARHPRRGMTIVEIMIASAISLIVVGAALWLLVEGMAVSWKTSNVSDNDLTHWSLNNRLVLDTRTANSLIVYSDFDASVITAEGIDGITIHTDPKRYVGNLLVLPLTLPSETANASGLRTIGCRRITGYRYHPSKHTLTKFIFPVSESDTAVGKPVHTILVENLSAIQASETVVASNVEVPTIGTQRSGAFYWDIASDTINARTAVLRFKMGDPNQHRRIRDSRLLEVSFFVRP